MTDVPTDDVSVLCRAIVQAESDLMRARKAEYYAGRSWREHPDSTEARLNWVEACARCRQREEVLRAAEEALMRARVTAGGAWRRCSGA